MVNRTDLIAELKEKKIIPNKLKPCKRDSQYRAEEGNGVDNATTGASMVAPSQSNNGFDGVERHATLSSLKAELKEKEKGCGDFHCKKCSLKCGDTIDGKLYLCQTCQAEIKGRLDVLKETISFIEKQRDKGNMLSNEKGFSAGICLSDLMKELKKEIKLIEDGIC